MKRFTGLLDKNRKKIYEGDLLKTGMRREDSSGWTTERVVYLKKGYWPFVKEILVLKSLHNEEFMEMQLDQELRELLK